MLLEPALEEARPTLLQKAEEGLPIWHYALQRPVLKLSVLPQELHEVCIKHGRDAPLAVMSPQENAEQIGRLLHQLGGDVKDMSKHETFRVIIPQYPRMMPPLGTVKGVEITALQRRDNRITQVGEQVANGKGVLLTGVQEIIGQATEFCCLRPQDHTAFGALPSIPTAAIGGFIGETKNHGVLIREEVVAPCLHALENPFLQEQSIRISHEHQADALRGQRLQDVVTPGVRHT